MTNDYLGSLEPSRNLNERLFFYEVVMHSYDRQSQFIKVPYRRMKQLQRITHMGGKILNITPDKSRSKLDLPWWIEIETSQPSCLYYFGPFDEIDEARSYEPGYLEDLRLEGAQEIRVQMKQCQPSVLTQEL